MAEATAQLNNYRQSPRKVRLVANTIKGKPVDQARISLKFVVKRGAAPLLKLLDSAIANAKSQNLGEQLFVKEITVNGGAILYRRLPMARGRAFPLKKRTSHVKITVAEGSGKQSKRAKRLAAYKKESK
jgi:large subunit ribosomal protein L22